MDFSFTKEQLEYRKTIIDFANRELNPGIVERDQVGTFSYDLWSKCADMRLLALPFPEKYGGEGFDFVTTIAIYHALGYGCKDSGLVHAMMSQVLCGIQIMLFGSEEQKEILLPELMSGKVVYAQAITEPGSGSDVFAMRTNSVKGGDGFVINGSKTMISNGPIADRVLLFAVTDPNRKTFGGISCFHITNETPGFSQGSPMKKMGLRTLMNGELIFMDSYVPVSSLIGREGQGAIIFNETMEWERILLPACLLGELERVLEESVRYAKEREAFGQSIGSFQAVAHKIAKMKMDAELGKLILYHAASLKDRKKRVMLESSIAKLFISESLKQACIDAVQLRGGYGYMTEFEVERDLRDSVVSTIYSGTSEMQMNIIARFAGL